MIKVALTVGAVVVGFAFATGCYVGWKTTMRIVDDVTTRKKVTNSSA